MVLNGGRADGKVPHGRHFIMSVERFRLSQLWRMLLEQFSTVKDYLSQNVNGAEVEKPWVRSLR